MENDPIKQTFVINVCFPHVFKPCLFVIVGKWLTFDKILPIVDDESAVNV